MIRHDYGADYKILCHRVSEDDTSLLKEFRCEYPAISRFVREECVKSKRDVTYAFIDEENNRVIGVCAICCSGISTNEEDDDGFKYRTNLPAVEIDYFAIDEDYRSLRYDEESSRYDTLSKALFLRMLSLIEEISNKHVGATHISLYSVKRAVSFYKRCGFEEFEYYMMRDEVPFNASCVPMYYKL